MDVTIAGLRKRWRRRERAEPGRVVFTAFCCPAAVPLRKRSCGEHPDIGEAEILAAHGLDGLLTWIAGLPLDEAGRRVAR